MQVFSKRKSALYSAGFLFTRELLHLLYDAWGNRWFIMLHGFIVKKILHDFMASLNDPIFIFVKMKKNIELARRKSKAYFSRA